MIRQVVCIALAFIMHFSLYAGLGSEWNYSRAVSYAQQEKWADAQRGMSQLMVDYPDDAALLYDSGVVAYRMKEFEKAEAYFNQAVCCDGTCDALKKQSHFNMGNTKVELKKLAEAIEPYETVLTIDPDDERAKHNLEIVRQMLQQQKEQQQDEQKKNKDQNQKKDNSQEQPSSDNKKKQDDAHERNEQQQSQSNDTQEQNGKSQDEDSGNDSKSGGQEEEQRSNNQDEGDEKDDTSGESDDKGRDQEQEQCASHDSSPQTNSEQTEEQKNRDAGFHNTQGEEKEQEMQEGEIDDGPELEDMRQQQQKKLEQKLAPHEQWMARVLKRSEEADEKANKRMVKAAIDKELAGKYGQNCW